MQKFQIVLLVVLIGCIAFVACERAQNTLEDVMMEPGTINGTDDGTTDDDGSTDDGTTDDDGSTDDGTTDNGSTDDGTTDDGSTDDGSTDDVASVLNTDVNGDGVVDLHDKIEVENVIGQPVDANNMNADVNGDGVIDEADVAAVEADIGTTSG